MKIADFGLAKKMRSKAAELQAVSEAGGAMSSIGSFSGGSSSTAGVLKGTRLYLAPELLEYAREVAVALAEGREISDSSSAPYGTTSDVWSV